MKIENWRNLADSFKNCPHPLNGRILKTAITGTGPYMYTDWDKNVVFDEQGIPLGSNGGIFKALSSVFGFTLKISTFNANVIWDNKTGQYIVISTLVSLLMSF